MRRPLSESLQTLVGLKSHIRFVFVEPGCIEVICVKYCNTVHAGAFLADLTYVKLVAEIVLMQLENEATC